ncbi:MAG TPA: hypothetical protein PLI53_00185 [Geobacteraceae bacterium]|nr:hypothetical protein [Geobacteraceae bacterium]
MDETPGGGKKGTSWCDDSIVISDSAERFKEDFAALVSRHFPMDWREVHESADTKSSVKMGRNAEPVEEKHGAVPAPERREPLGTERFIAESKPSRKSAGDVADVAVTEDAPVERMHRQDTISDFSAVPVKRKRGRYFAFLGVVALLLGAWAYLYLFRNGTDNRHETGKIIAPIPVDRKTPPVPSANREEQRKIVDLPAWIPPATRDPSYREGHPGWERYLLPEYDVRVFREGPPIKALQVIARTEKGVSGAFLLSVLEGFGYKGPLPSGSERKKDNFLVRSVKLDGFGELVTYREEGASSLKAFILEFT